MPASLSRAQWAERITAATRKTVEAIIEVGKLLIEAKTKLKHGEFVAMVRNDLPFKERTAQRLMKIARSERLANASIQTLLPAHLHTLHDLAELSPADFEDKLAAGVIRPDMKRADLHIQIAEQPSAGRQNFAITYAPRPPEELSQRDLDAAIWKSYVGRIVDACTDLARIPRGSGRACCFHPC